MSGATSHTADQQTPDIGGSRAHIADPQRAISIGGRGFLRERGGQGPGASAAECLEQGLAAVLGTNGRMSKPSYGRVNFRLAMSTELWREFAIARCVARRRPLGCAGRLQRRGAEAPGWLGIVPWFVAAAPSLVATLMWTSGQRCAEVYKLMGAMDTTRVVR